MSTTYASGYSPSATGLQPGTAAPVTSVAILGAGRVGTALARAAVAGGFDVAVAGSGAADGISLIITVVAPGARAADAADAVAEADVVFVAVPLSKLHTVDPAMLAGKVAVAVTNYWEPVDGHLPQFAGAGQGTSAEVASMFPGARWVKAFNHIGYHDIDEHRSEPGSDGRRALAVASDDADAAATVMHLVDRMGFDALYAGSLAQGTLLEAGGPVFGVRLTRAEFEAKLASGHSA